MMSDTYCQAKALPPIPNCLQIFLLFPTVISLKETQAIIKLIFAPFHRLVLLLFMWDRSSTVIWVHFLGSGSQTHSSEVRVTDRKSRKQFICRAQLHRLTWEECYLAHCWPSGILTASIEPRMHSAVYSASLAVSEDRLVLRTWGNHLATFKKWFYYRLNVCVLSIPDPRMKSYVKMQNGMVLGCETFARYLSQEGRTP